MTSLERRYRRLIRIYPADHRAAYEEEMIGVLLAGAGPGRRFPSPADAVDLVRAGVTVRLGRAFHIRRGTGWRDAAAVTALFAALLMTGAAINRLVAVGSPGRWIRPVLGARGLALAVGGAAVTRAPAMEDLWFGPFFDGILLQGDWDAGTRPAGSRCCWRRRWWSSPVVW